MARSDGRTDAKTPRRQGKRTGGPTHRRTAARRRADRGTSGLAGAPRVLLERRDGVATLTLNRPDKRNAIDQAMVAELRAAITACDLAADVRVVAIRGAGQDFCAGADLAELLASAQAPAEENERSALALGEVFVALRGLAKPTVAIVHGRALAGGCGLALACDVVVARSDAVIGFPEIRRGFVPAMVLALLRRAVGEKVAFDLAATGRPIEAAEAGRLGLVSRVLPRRAFEGAVTKLLSSLAASSPSALALLKQEFHRLDGMDFEDGVRLGARVNAAARMTPDFARAVAAFLGK